MKKLIILFLLLSIQICLSNYINNLRKAAKSKSGECLIIFYFEMSNCMKCYIEPNLIISHLEKEKKMKKHKIIGIVVCDRDLELNIFIKEHNWKYPVLS